MAPEIRTARDVDLAPCRALLQQCELTIRGLERDFPCGYVVAYVGAAIVGAAGVERHDEAGLLRSVAVAAAARGGGLGAGLVRECIARARERSLTSLWLLTTTAPGFFERIGFTRSDRGEAPAAVRDSEEFLHVCPASAVCMSLRLTGWPQRS
jgi:amino-acid N-acetyltransferase